jgi:GNAT superfamily N-acetyltransferase
MSRYQLLLGYENMDMGSIHAYLSSAYWSPGVPFEIVERAARNSLCVGVFEGQQQVAYARAVTDRATFAYLADVYVLEAHRGQGLSKAMLNALFKHEDLQGLRRMMLATRDAHALYRRFGFTELNSPAMMMELHRPNAYAESRPEPALHAGLEALDQAASESTDASSSPAGA